MSGLPERPKPSVVLVDDSSDVRALVRRQLELSGLFEVVGEGGDGNEAISLAHRHEPALLLLDTSMPTMDGIEALPAILALCPETKVVMFTGFEEQGLATRARELGAVDFVEKSIQLEDLPSRLMRSLTRGPPPAAATRPRLSIVSDTSGTRELPAAGQEQVVLREHLAQFRELFDQAAIGMATLTVSGTIVRANRALARLMSCSPYDLVGVDYGRLTGGAGEELDRRLEAISSFGADLTAFEHPLPVRRGEATSPLVRATLTPVRDRQRQVLYVFAQVQDITAQREAEGDLRRSEENFRLLVSAVGEYAIFMLDVEGNVISWNAGAKRIKGYAADEIVGRSFTAFYPPEEQATGHPARNLEVALREGELAEEGWRLRKDGSRFWASVVISPVYDDAGIHIGFAKVTRDQTDERDHAEARRNATLEQTQLLALTAHELRSPTAVIDGSAGALRASWDEMSVAQRDGLLAGIRSSAHRLHRLGSDLATASRLQGETLQLRLAEVALDETLRGAAARRHAVGADVRVEVDAPQGVAVHADAVRLAQALDNLIDNAVRHGAPPIALTAVAVDGDVHIRVTDAGPGVPLELVPRLFDRFAVGGPSGGTGLGLYLVREIARAHAGEAEYVAPSAGQPAEFRMVLPRA